MTTVRSVRVAGYLVVIAIRLGSPSPALAQADELGRLEISASAGWSGFTDSQGTIGKGTNTAVGVAFFVLPKLSFGVELNHTVHSGFLPLQDQIRRSDGRVTFASVNASYYFAHANLLGFAMAPYVIGGGGKAIARRRDRYLRPVVGHGQSGFSSGLDYSEQLLHEDTIDTHEGAFNLGTGLDVGITERIALRPEFRFFGASSQKMMRGSIAVAFRW